MELTDPELKDFAELFASVRALGRTTDGWFVTLRAAQRHGGLSEVAYQIATAHRADSFLQEACIYLASGGALKMRRQRGPALMCA